MTIEKLPSGSFRITEMVNGKRYRKTVAQKPSKKEATMLIAEMLKDAPAAPSAQMTFEEAMDKYNEIKAPVLSPSTIKDYKNMPNRYSEAFKSVRICDMTSLLVQSEINRYIAEKNPSPKTLKNVYGYIIAVLKQFNPDYKPLRVDLPKANKEEPYIPTTAEVNTIRAAAKGTKFETGIELACYGLRRSELLAITDADIDPDCTLHINKSMVEDSNKEWIIKTYGKTDDSQRDIIISQELADLIREQKKVCQYHPGQLLRFLSATQKANNIKAFSLHKLRHWACTELHKAGVCEADLLKHFGWSKRSDVMKVIYRHENLSRDAEARKDVATKFMSVLK